MKKFFKPLEEINGTGKSTILMGWLVILISFWVISSFGSIHMFPTPAQVLTGFSDLCYGGLVVHIGSSLALCGMSVFLSILIALVFAYSSTIPFFKPIGTFISKLRYLPLTGISFYTA